MNKFILPKPTLLDYLLPGLVNIKSKRFVSSGISVLIIVIGLMWSLFSNYSINSFVWTTPIIIFFYSLNYFVCKKQDKRKMFFSDQVTQFILYVNYLLYFAFFYLISISILLRLEKNNPVYTVGVLFWAGLATLGILMFFYHFELHVGGYKPKQYEFIRHNDFTIGYFFKNLHPYGETGLISKSMYLSLKLLDIFTNKFATKYIKYFNDNTTPISLKNSAIASMVMSVSQLLSVLLFLALLTIFVGVILLLGFVFVNLQSAGH